jgi:hypothetical protein
MHRQRPLTGPSHPILSWAAAKMATLRSIWSALRPELAASSSSSFFSEEILLYYNRWFVILNVRG